MLRNCAISGNQFQVIQVQTVQISTDLGFGAPAAPPPPSETLQAALELELALLALLSAALPGSSHQTPSGCVGAAWHVSPAI